MKKNKEPLKSHQLYYLCKAGDLKGWEEASCYIYEILSWKKWQLEWNDKDDLMQDTLIYIANYLPRVKKPKAFKALIRQKVKWLIIDFKRIQKKERGVTVPLPPPGGGDNENYPGPVIPSPIPGPEDEYFWKQVAKIYKKVISSLEEHCEKLLQVFFNSNSIEKDLEIIAIEQGVLLNTIKSRYYRCRNDFIKNPEIIKLAPEL